MAQATRAIIIENGSILVMRRVKRGSEYYTLVGGRVNEGETVAQGLQREVREETGMEVTSAEYVYYEEHAEPYNEQFIFVCKVAPHQDIALQEASEEALMNKSQMIETNTHEPLWVSANAFKRLAFRTPALQAAIITAFKKGFPKQAIRL
jgi:ADP-ribose pyrophosphatase YjhB (NUDIX family)